MGQQSAVISASRRSSEKAKSAPRPIRLNIDVPLLLVTITLVVMGILMLYSASWDISFLSTETHSLTYMLTRQLMWLGLGLVGMVAMAWLNYHSWQHLAVWSMLAAIVALIVVLLFGDGTRSWSGGSYQPSELAKFVIVIYLAVWLYAKKDQLGDANFGLFPLAAILGIVGGLIFSQPDLSAAATVIILGGIMFYLAGGDLRQITILLIVAILVGLLVVAVNPTGSNRVDSFLAGLKNPLESSDHVQRSLSAFARGGWFGVGIGRGTTKLTSLPVPHTDSIFAVVGEELGVVGASVIACLFGLLLWRGLLIARRAPDGLGSLMAAGLTIWITMEAAMNMLALIGLMPFAGNTLPFFSVGGSSLVFSLAAVGIVLNISRLSEQEQETQRRTFSALIDLRGRDRRRRVSRARRARTSKR